MTPCPARLGGDPDGLRCNRTTPHNPDAIGGHVYVSSAAGMSEGGHRRPEGSDS